MIDNLTLNPFLLSRVIIYIGQRWALASYDAYRMINFGEDTAVACRVSRCAFGLFVSQYTYKGTDAI